ncbi:HNH endonuclease family protein [Gordonia sihwensis]|uniref:HNH endonuclease family protein n=1 Tax=Gordonia sihwensis TaxID=173559 RepID=UPI001E4945EA|nr:HNH endonuclease family protein [Gordonia sihwensis]
MNDIATSIDIPSQAPVSTQTDPVAEPDNAAVTTSADVADALTLLGQLPVKGRAPKTGYSRAQFGKAWTDDNGTVWGGDKLSTRENVLSRDLTNIVCKTRSKQTNPPCVVQSGTLVDPYTGDTVQFKRGNRTSELIPVDHVVSLGDSWQKGAQQITAAQRIDLANDPLNLIATQRNPNSAKSDSDAASWLVPRKSWRCKYVARQIAVKGKYRLWVTKAEKDAMIRVLQACPGQPLPTEYEAQQRTA